MTQCKKKKKPISYLLYFTLICMCQLLEIKYIVLVLTLLLLNLSRNSECLKFLQIHRPVSWQTK